MISPGSRFLSAISYYSASVARALHRRNVDIRIVLIRELCPRFLYPGRRHVGRYDRSVLHLGSIPADEILDWFSVPSLWWSYQRLSAQHPDILLLQWWTSAMAHNYLALARRAKQLGCSVVVELHELRDVGEQGIPLASAYTNLMISRLANYTDGVIVHSHSDQHAVVEQYPRLGRLPSTVIFHGPQEHSRGVTALPEASAGATNPRVTRFLYFGVIRPYKGVSELIEAFRTLLQEGLQVHLTIAGEPWTGLDDLLRQLEECGQNTYSLFLEYVPDNLVTSLFSECDVLVAPYRRVSASGPISMAMGAGKPIVTTRLPALLEACEGYGGVEWADPGSAQSLASAMKRALDLVGGNYQNPHSWDANANEYIAFFSRILGRNPERSV